MIARGVRQICRSLVNIFLGGFYDEYGVHHKSDYHYTFQVWISSFNTSRIHRAFISLSLIIPFHQCTQPYYPFLLLLLSQFFKYFYFSVGKFSTRWILEVTEETGLGRYSSLYLFFVFLFIFLSAFLYFFLHFLLLLHVFLFINILIVVHAII